MQSQTEYDRLRSGAGLNQQSLSSHQAGQSQSYLSPSSSRQDLSGSPSRPLASLGPSPASTSSPFPWLASYNASIRGQPQASSTDDPASIGPANSNHSQSPTYSTVSRTNSHRLGQIGSLDAQRHYGHTDAPYLPTHSSYGSDQGAYPASDTSQVENTPIAGSASRPVRAQGHTIACLPCRSRKVRCTTDGEQSRERGGASLRTGESGDEDDADGDGKHNDRVPCDQCLARWQSSIQIDPIKSSPDSHDNRKASNKRKIDDRSGPVPITQPPPGAEPCVFPKHQRGRKLGSRNKATLAKRATSTREPSEDHEGSSHVSEPPQAASRSSALPKLRSQLQSTGYNLLPPPSNASDFGAGPNGVGSYSAGLGPVPTNHTIPSDATNRFGRSTFINAPTNSDNVVPNLVAGGRKYAGSSNVNSTDNLITVPGNSAPLNMVRNAYQSTDLRLSDPNAELGSPAQPYAPTFDSQEPVWNSNPRFKSKLDVDSNLDPVNIGMLSTEKAEELLKLSCYLLVTILLLAATHRGVRGGPEDARLAGALVRHSFRLWPYVLLGNVKNVHIVQAMMLQGSYLPPSEPGEDDMSWSFFAHAIRVASEIGLNCDPPVFEPVDVPDHPTLPVDWTKRNRERTWMTCLLADQSWASQTGRPPLLAENGRTRDLYKWLSHDHRFNDELAASFPRALQAAEEALAEWRDLWLTAKYAYTERLGKIGYVYYWFAMILIYTASRRKSAERPSALKTAMQAASLLNYVAHGMPSDVELYCHNNTFTMISFGCVVLTKAKECVPDDIRMRITSDLRALHSRYVNALAQIMTPGCTLGWHTELIGKLNEFWTASSHGHSPANNVEEELLRSILAFDPTWAGDMDLTGLI